jgi:leucyl/phenylalanyl-tRNA--protein transferase
MIALPQLHPRDIRFPAPEQALTEPNGLLAFGGDLRPERLLAAYRLGIFPWYQDDQPILWWSPDPRAVLIPERIHISRSLRRAWQRSELKITMDQSFAGVIQGCAESTAERPGTWITAAMQRAYCRLHELGHAHSIEVWRGSELVGGMYGIALGGVFFGESMFSRVTNASKIALVHLCGQLRQWGFAVIDCQVSSNHLRSMGACEISRREFQQLLEQHTARSLPCNGRPWQLTWRWIELER